jgi:gamma-glutamyltranspeptidase / glutathione hydrolase
VAIAQILGKLEHFDLPRHGPAGCRGAAPDGRRHAARLRRPRPLPGRQRFRAGAGAGADRSRLPGRARRLLEGDDALPEVSAGEPDWDHALLWGDDLREGRPATSHISIVDGDGNVLSMTTTIESGFGSRIFVRGLPAQQRAHRLLLPHPCRRLADRQPGGAGQAAALVDVAHHRAADGAPVLAIGSPGGATIIGYTAQAIIAHLDWGMDVQEAVSMPHLVNSFGTYQIEAGTWAEDLAEPLWTWASRPT